MPLRLDITKKLYARSDRVKAVDFHPTEPWVLACLYNGQALIWNFETQTLLKTFEVSELPVRTGCFIARKNWIVVGADDMHIRVFNYNTLEKVTTFEGHMDYIRSIAVHPTLPIVLSSSDDMTIRAWDWEKGWRNFQTFEGHSHYVMQVVFNPRDPSTFASASLDRTIKVWQIGAAVPNFTLEGHERGVNCLDFYPGSDRPLLISGADDMQIKVWDLHSKSPIQTLRGHTQNLSVVTFHPTLPLIISGSEDGTVRLWHSHTFRLENTLSYGLERVWAIATRPGNNDVAIGFDEGTVVLKLGREEPLISMDHQGKVVWCRNNEVQTLNLGTLPAESFSRPGQAMVDGFACEPTRVVAPTKELGESGLFPQSLSHSPNGRFVAVVGDDEYILYSALAWRQMHFGQALDFVWSHQPNYHAVRHSGHRVQIFHQMKETRTIQTNFPADAIFGGACLAVCSSSFVCFFDWEFGLLTRRIDVSAHTIIWNQAGDHVAICSDDSIFLLSYDAGMARSALAAASATGELLDEQGGVEGVFNVTAELSDSLLTGCWVENCFVYTTRRGSGGSSTLAYATANGSFRHVLATLEQPRYLLGYLPKVAGGRLVLADRDCALETRPLPLSLLAYQSAVARDDRVLAERLLPFVPKSLHNELARFASTRGDIDAALALATDRDLKFDLAMKAGRLELAMEQAEALDRTDIWAKIAERALADWSQFHLAEKALMRAGDLPGLLMYYNACGNEEGLRKVARLAEEAESTNVAFAANWVTHNLVDCAQILLDTGREAEAAMLARTYRPDLVDHCLDHWKSVLSITHPRVAGSLARPDAVAFGSANAAPPAGHLSSRGDRQAETPSLDTETLSIRSTESGSSSTAHSPTLEDMPRSGGVSPTADLASYSRQAQPLDGGFSASGAGSPGMPGAGAATPLTTGLEDRLAALPMVAPPPAAGEARAPFAMPTFASGGSGAVAASSSSSPSSPGLSRGGSPGGGSPLVTAAQPPGTSSSPLFTGLQPSASPSSASPFGVAAGSPVAPGPGSPGNRSPAAPAAQWSNPASPFSTTDDFDF